MRNGEALAKLGPAHRSFGLFVEHGVGVVVKSLQLRAGQEQNRVFGAAEIEFRRAAIVRAMEVTDRQRWFRFLAGADNRLRSQKYFGDTVCTLPGHTVVDHRLAGGQKLQSWMNGKFDHFVRRETGGKFGGMVRGAQARFKLQVTRRCERGWSRNRGTPWVCFWFFTHRCLRFGSQSKQRQRGKCDENPPHLPLDALER